jgi:hypothetical protein
VPRVAVPLVAVPLVTVPAPVATATPPGGAAPRDLADM